MKRKKQLHPKWVVVARGVFSTPACLVRIHHDQESRELKRTFRRTRRMGWRRCGTPDRRGSEPESKEEI